MDTSRCVVIVVHDGTITLGCEKGLRELEKLGYAVRRVAAGGAVELARSAAAAQALEDGFDDVMYVGPDIDFDPADVARLRRHAAFAVVGAVYPEVVRPGYACEFLPGAGEVTLGHGGKVHEVRAVDFGFCLTRRAAYDAVRAAAKLPDCLVPGGRPVPPWFLPHVSRDGGAGRWRADGRGFCDRVRQAGHKVAVDATIRVWRTGPYQHGWEDAWGHKDRYESYRFTPPADPTSAASRGALRGPIEPLADTYPRFGMFVMTMEKNRDSLERTLDSVRQSDWGAEPVVVTQPPDWEPGRSAGARNYKRVLEAALADGCDVAVILEDDVRVSRYLRHNLTRCPLVARDQCDYLSLFIPDLVAGPWERPEPHLGYRLAKPIYTGPNNDWAKYKLWGSQGYALSRRLVAACVELWDGLGGGQDARVIAVCERFRLPLWYTMPCLVQHDPTQTAHGTPPAYAADFDPDWKLAPSDGFQPPEAVPGWLSVGECRLLWEQAAGADVLEIGTASAQATVSLAQRARRVVVVSVDHGDHAEAAEWVRRFGVADRVDMRQGDVGEVCRAVGGRYGLALIDGHHDAASVARDIAVVLPLLAPGGRLAFHDYPDPAWPDVRRVVDDHARRLGWKRVAQADYLGVFAV